MTSLTPHMTKAQVKFYLDRLTPFLNDTEIAGELGVTRITWVSWKTGQTVPILSRLEDFEQARQNLVKHFHRKNRDNVQGFFGQLADIIAQDDPPPHFQPDLPGISLDFLRDELIKRVQGKRVKSNPIVKDLLELGYTRMQISHAAKKLGIVSTVGKRGRGGFYWWSL